MEPIQALRFRLINQTLEPYFQSGELVLLHCNYGYLCFTTKAMHAAFKNAGNGQWQDLEDLFYFTISFDAEDKDTLKKKGVEIELWCYANSDVRLAYASKIAGKEGLGTIYSKKGFDLVYKLPIIPLKEKAAEYQQNSELLCRTLTDFASNKIHAIERVLLS